MKLFSVHILIQLFWWLLHSINLAMVRRFCSLLICLCLLSVYAEAQPGGNSQSVTTSNNKHLIQAGILHKLPQYVEWPSKVDTFVFSFLGKTLTQQKLGSVLEYYNIKKFGTVDPMKIAISCNNQICYVPVKVYRYNRTQDFTASGVNSPVVKRTNILFVTEDVHLSQKKLQQIGQNSIMIVGEKPEFGTQGGHLNFTIMKNKTDLELNLPYSLACDLDVNPDFSAQCKIVKNQE